ncbi:MAG TPA: YebC/PmpR family DNA-binding transcriptional regulator [Spirochaetia bacterium]|nr:YebC/PmpR family DNA-binding transcriptional regulator [Spirochaetia bacterium]
MSGHNKFANIKHRKGAQDAKKGKIFTKIIKELTIAAKTGGGDPNGNPRLRLAIEKAREANMPKDNMEKAIKRGTGELEGINYEEAVYEGYALAGVAILIDSLTDNKNRTTGEIRSILTKNGGAMAEAGAVAWNFERQGMIVIQNAKEDDVMEVALENGGDDVEQDEDMVFVYCNPESLMSLTEELKKKFEVTSSEITKSPKTTIKIEDKETAEKILRIIDLIDDHDDVQKVYSNADIDPAILDEA